MAFARVGVVTGANKGIGYAIVRQLALQYSASPLSNGALLIYLTARDTGRGETALRKIQQDSELEKAKALRSHGGLVDVRFHQLDISDSQSIEALVQFLAKEHPSGIDFAINNAGMAMDGFNNTVVETTLRSNYYGTLEATRAFIPIMKPDGRIVNVASMAGSLGKYSSAIARRFRSAKTDDDITMLMREFADAVSRDAEKKEGWPSAAYAVSKSGVIGMTKAIAAELSAQGSEIELNSCCPGWVVTDMTKGRGYKTPDQGAQTPVMLALQGSGGKMGKFWQDERVAEW